MKIAVFTGTLLCCLLARGQDATPIRQVESGLLPPYTIEGETTPKWHLADRMKHYKVPAVSIAVVRHGKIEWAKAYGSADTTTLFQAASISKPVAAIAAMTMVQEGKSTLDEDVNGKLKSWSGAALPIAV
jgi:CubicO group peptidase (beta-lactamase class C family)